MPKYQYNKPLTLINKRPKGEKMTENGYGYYMFPSLVMQYANKALKDRERRLYFAISGQAEKDKKGNPCCWTIKHYCQIANIGSNHYSEVLDSLCEKGFIIHNNFETIEVIYLISETEELSPTGKIISRRDLQNSKNENSMEQKLFSQNKEENYLQNGNVESNFRKDFSQSKANNKEINNNINNLNKDKEVLTSPKGEVGGEKPKRENPIDWGDLL